MLSILGKKWYFDSFYNRAFVLPALLSGYNIFFKALDKGIIEQFGPTGVVPFVLKLSKSVKSIQSGYLHLYLTLIVSFFILFILF